MGVRRAMEIVLAEAHKQRGPLYTFGPLIHNKLVLDLLSSKGVKPVEDLNGLQSGRIVIRAHGIPPQVRETIKKTGLKAIDATCPKVARVQAIIRYHTKKGYSAVIVGDRDHAEVIGLKGYGQTPAHVIQGVKDVPFLPQLDRVVVVAQTTQNEQTFHEVIRALEERFPELLVFDTICDATHQRQQEVRSFARQVDAIVVVGGYHSGNTQRLAQVSREAGLPTFHVESEKDLDRGKLAGMDLIGVTAGASTPNWIIKDVVRKIEGFRGRGYNPLARCMKQVLKYLVLSNLFVASGAFSFAYAIAFFSKRASDFTLPSITFFYIYAMHILNRFLDKGAGAYNDPERASFLKNHRRPLITAGIISIVTALALSGRMGIFTVMALGGLCLFGIIYSIPFLPEKIRHRHPYSKIKDIPASRTLSESLAWVAVIAILPLLEIKPISWPTAIISILIVFLMSFVRAGLSDIFQAQGDLIVGTETLPIMLGEKKTLILLRFFLVAAGSILTVCPLLGLVDAFSFVLLLPLFTLSLCLIAYERRWLYPGIRLEAMVEGNFILAGLLAILWQAL